MSEVSEEDCLLSASKVHPINLESNAFTESNHKCSDCLSSEYINTVVKASIVYFYYVLTLYWNLDFVHSLPMLHWCHDELPAT